MRVSLDLYTDDRGGWRADAYDLPDRSQPSTALPCRTADIAAGGSGAAPAGARRLTLNAVLPTPYAARALDGGAPTLYVYVYQPVDRGRMLDFERRIEPRYQEYYAGLGVLYAGVFDVEGVDGECIAEILSFDRPLDEATRFVAEFEPAPDIQRIEEECRTLQRRDAPRHLIWLSR